MKIVPLFYAVLGLVFTQASQVVRADVVSAKMQEYVDSGVISGAVTLVASKSGVEHLGAVGQSDLAKGQKMKKNGLFWIASMTKPMTAICVLMLQEKGLLAIEDTVEKYLPEFKGQWLIEQKDKDRVTLVRPKRAVTIRDLLTHTGGLSDVKSPRTTSTLGELAMAYAREPLQFEPGSKWAYSNPGINILGRIVEIVSGQKFENFIQDNLFDPLEMNDTTFWPNKEQAKRLVKSYTANKETGKLEETAVYFMQGASITDRHRTPFPAGGLFSNAADVARLYRMMLNGGEYKGKRLLKSETVELMTTTQSGDIKTGFVEGMSWGLGFQVVKEPQGVTANLSPGSFGHGGAYATQSWGDPKAGRVYVMLIQRAGLGNSDAAEIRGAFQDVAAHLAVAAEQGGKEDKK